MIMNDAIAIAKTTLTDPKNLGNTIKSVAAANIVSIKNSADVKIIESTLKKLEPIVPIKPTILEIQKVIMPVIMPVVLAPPVPIRSTLIAPSIITPLSNHHHRSRP
jgi:capsular polysaccharide biosynthesis protein